MTSASHLEIPLMMAERAWAFAMQRKQETADAPYRVRRHVVTRLAKAAKVRLPRVSCVLNLLPNTCRHETLQQSEPALEPVGLGEAGVLSFSCGLQMAGALFFFVFHDEPQQMVLKVLRLGLEFVEAPFLSCQMTASTSQYLRAI